jgi:hypothetical protein
MALESDYYSTAEFGEDWWQQAPVVERTAGILGEYLVGIFVGTVSREKPVAEIFTGFLMEEQDRLCWCSAGHVIEQVDKWLEEYRHERAAMKWVLLREGGKLEMWPLQNLSMVLFSAHEQGVDFGLAALEGLDLASFRQVRGPTPLRLPSAERSVPEPEGFYMIGFPADAVRTIQRPLSNEGADASTRFRMQVLPIRRVPYLGPQEAKEFWSDPGAFYGEILPTLNSTRERFAVPGMSGGPLFGVTRGDSYRINARLWGVQRSWDPASTTIRCEPVHKLRRVMPLTR